MTLETLLFLWAGALAGGFINGLAGFGTALFALGWWLQVLPTVQAVAIVLAMSVVSGIQGAIVVRRSIDPRLLALFVVPALLGIPVGSMFLDRIDAGQLKLVIGGFMLVYGGFFIVRRDLPDVARPMPVLDAAIGFAGGVLGAIAGLSGALPTMWLALRDWTKTRTRALLQPFNVIVLGSAALLLAFRGGYDGQTLLLIAIAFPVTMIGAQIGIWLFRHLTDRQFRRLLIAMMFVSGAVLLVRELT